MYRHMVDTLEATQALSMLTEAENCILRVYARMLIEGTSCESPEQQQIQSAAMSILQRRELSFGAIAFGAISEVLAWTPARPQTA